MLPALPDGDEHHDPDLFLPTAARRLLSAKEKLGEAEREQEVSERLTEGGLWDYFVFLQRLGIDLFSSVKIVLVFLSVVSHLQINAAGGDLNWKR